jgi:hypothetical protein
MKNSNKLIKEVYFITFELIFLDNSSHKGSSMQLLSHKPIKDNTRNNFVYFDDFLCVKMIYK